MSMFTIIEDMGYHVNFVILYDEDFFFHFMHVYEWVCVVYQCLCVKAHIL